MIFYQARGTVMALAAAGLFLLMVLPGQDRPKLGEVAGFCMYGGGMCAVAGRFVGIMPVCGKRSDIVNNLKFLVRLLLIRDIRLVMTS